MVEAGYSENKAKNPSNLTKSKAWEEYMETFLDDEKLARIHAEGLEAGRTIYKNNVSTGEIEMLGFEPDYATRHKYLDSAYKLKGTYAPEKKLVGNFNLNDEQREKAKSAIKNIAS